MKHILLLNYEFPPIGGGGSSSSYDLAIRLAESGKFNIDVVTMGFRDLPTFEIINSRLRIHRVSCLRQHASSCSPLEQATYVRAGYKKCRDLIATKNFNICHCHFIIPTGLLARKLKVRFGLNYIITAHGSDVLGHNPKFKPYYPLVRSAWNKILVDSQHIVCASAYLKQRILDQASLIPPEKISVIPNAAANNRYKPYKKKPLILLVGRLAKNKGVQDFIEALRTVNLSGWRVKIVGDGPYRRLIEKRISRYGLKTKVQLVGRLNPGSSRLKTLYGQASIFVSPSHFENMSLSLLEAMQAGCSIISTNVGGSAEVVTGIGVLTPPHNPEALAHHLNELIPNSQKLSLMQKKSLSQDKHLSKINVAQKYSRILSMSNLIKKNTVIKDGPSGQHPISVCFISRSAYPVFDPSCNATFGGAETETYLIATELAKDPRFKVKLIAGDFNQENHKIIENVEIIKGYRASDLRFIQLIKLMNRIIKANSDWYYQGSASGGSGLISFFCKIRKRKFLYRTTSDIDCDGRFVKDNKLEGVFYKYGIANANLIATQNLSNSRDLKKVFHLTSTLIKSPFRLPQQQSTGRKYILWVARSNKLKQPEIFLELAKSLSGYHFIMICPKANTDSVDYEMLKKTVESIPNLTFIPKVEFAKIDKYFSQAQLFVNTSTYEGFPITFIQALMHGCPVCSLNVNPDNFITRYRCGILAKGDTQILRDEIRRLMINRIDYRECSDNAFNYAQQHHNISVTIEKFKRIFLG